MAVLEYLKIKKDKMQEEIQKLAGLQIATLSDIADYLQTTEDLVRMDLKELGIEEESLPKESDKEALSHLYRRRNQLFAEIAEFPPEQHLEECSKYGFTFPESMYNAFKDSVLFEECDEVSFFEQLLNPVPETELVEKKQKTKQYRNEKMRHEVSLLYTNGYSIEEIEKKLSIHQNTVEKLLTKSAKEAGLANRNQLKNKQIGVYDIDSYIRGKAVYNIDRASESLDISKKDLKDTKQDVMDERIVRDYETGMTQDEVAEKYGITRAQVSYRAKRYYSLHPDKYDWDNFKRVEHSPKKVRERKAERNQRFTAMAKKGYSVSEIARIMNVSDNLVYTCVRNNENINRNIKASVDDLAKRRGLVWITTILHEDRRNFKGVIVGKATTDLRLQTGEDASTIGNDLSILRSAVKFFGNRKKLEEYVVTHAEEAEKQLNTPDALFKFLQEPELEKVL